MEAIKRISRVVLLEFMRLLAAYERRQLERVMQERLETERFKQLH
jgi:hypothetical protein